MSPRARNRWIWLGCAAVVLAMWGLVARVRMHLVDEPLFLACVTLAAVVLSALYWWDVAADDDDHESDSTQAPKDS